MRGLTHFIVGLTIATFFKSLVFGAAAEDSLIILLGGIFGLLPDTIDFKFLIYMEEHDTVIDPHPDKIDPKEIAEKVAEGINKAAEMKPGKMYKIKLHTIRLGPDLWRQYSVFFNAKEKKVEVRVGPHVTTSGVPIPGTEPPEEKAYASAKFKPNIIETYGKPTEIKGFGGPSFGFLKREDGSVEIIFIPFHRRAGHSITLGLLLSAVVGAILRNWIAWLVAFLGWLGHIIFDSYGHMGGNLFWPFTKKRLGGLQLVSASDPFWNSLIVYSCMAIILWNLNKYNALVSSSYAVPAILRLGLPIYLLLIICVPWSIIGIVYLWLRGRAAAGEVATPATAGVAAVAEEEREPDEDLFVPTVPKPPLILRILGISVLFILFGFLFWLGPSL
ncbi:MAG: metal-dependent hydrolase [Candidatus Hadarchaeales archaeon]